MSLPFLPSRAILAPNIAALSPAASAAPPAFAYRTTVVDTANVASGSSYTFSATAVGTAHAQRIVLLGVMQTQTISALTVAGNAASLVDSNGQFSLWQVALASGTTADIVVTISVGTSARCVVAVWAGYPASSTKVDSGNDTKSGTTDAVISDLECVNGGFVVYVGGQTGVLGAFGTTWGGVDAVVEDTDQQVESVATFTAGHILTTENQTLNDLTMAETVSGSKQLVAASYGAS